jgi:hypothetical protein
MKKKAHYTKKNQQQQRRTAVVFEFVTKYSIILKYLSKIALILNLSILNEKDILDDSMIDSHSCIRQSQFLHQRFHLFIGTVLVLYIFNWIKLRITGFNHGF